ncbi:putative E3 ubiquitin-protein ligase [Nymphaea thermarum]|nr:putative E3 ubiquitin-protein ligase [Nymphaea thermarum]
MELVRRRRRMEVPIFKRYLCPEKDYLSFSLIYDNGERSLDLVCKDKIEAEAWFAGLKALISSGQHERSKIDGRSNRGLYFDDNGDFTSDSQSENSLAKTLETRSDKYSKNLHRPLSDENSTNAVRSYIGTDNTNMQVKGANSDAFRVSVSSALSSSSQGSGQDDCDAFGDVYIWGQIFCDASLLNGNVVAPRIDLLLPRSLDSNIVLDVHAVSCGGRHAALVTRQGEVFTWGEESGGRLGHGVGMDSSQPQLVELFTTCNADFVACGEFHTCAVTMAGDLFTWGDATHTAGLLGHTSEVSHWIPKRVCGPLEGIQVAGLSCGTWHTALITSTGQLYTFGDGTFGVLGHGDRTSVPFPREVESLKGLKTIAVACGVWHTAAVVEVIVTQSSVTTSSGKLFTWGDGDKNRLGHGDKEIWTVPTCVPSLIEYNFHKVACGHNLTVGLTTSGRVFTMGSMVYGQLGNPRSDGKVPILVEDKLANESIEDISCGSYHVAVLTSRNEVYTWGKGANGRLGHGDIEDRKTPTLIEALKDRHVKHISCGSNFTAAICLHRWLSGMDQSQCSACRQTFGFTRKRHHCYNCGHVHCHSCSSKKALRAALSPNPGKAYRVCDSCYFKLNKISEAGGSSSNRKAILPRLSGDNKDKLDRPENRTSKSELVECIDFKTERHGKRPDSLSLVLPSQMANSLQLKDFSVSSTVTNAVHKPVNVPLKSGINSAAVSPFSRKSSPRRSVTPVPTRGGISFSKSIADALKRTNELLTHEVQKLQAQVDSLKQQCELQDYELQKSARKAQEAMSQAAEETAKCKAAKEVIRSLTLQLKDIAEKIPPGAYCCDDIRPIFLPDTVEANSTRHSDAKEVNHHVNYVNHGTRIESLTSTGFQRGLNFSGDDQLETTTRNSLTQDPKLHQASGEWGLANSVMQSGEEKLSPANGSAENSGTESETVQSRQNGTGLLLDSNNQVESERVEQYEPGVYITLLTLRDGTKDIKRVRFSRKRFAEHQAETWWSENREKVFAKYSIGGEDKSLIRISADAGP